MTSLDERVKAIEEEIRKTPYHKATEHHIGRLRAKLARLKERLEAPSKSKGKREGFAVKKTGDATVVLVGPPSVGKSTLLNKLTRASSKVGEYDFTTLEVVPGILEYKGAKIQVLDIPGLVGGAAKGRGRGREILSVARIADLLLLMVDTSSIGMIDQIKKELHEAGVRLNQEPPEVKIKKLSKGGLKVVSQSVISAKAVKEIGREFGLVNAEIIVKKANSINQLIDAFASNRVYTPALVIVNKIDLLNAKDAKKIKKNDVILISAKEKAGLERLKEKIFKSLGLIRVYLRPKGQEVDFEKPLILKKEAMVADAVRKLSKELVKEIKFARVWGFSAKHPGQQVSLSHKLADRDTLSF